MFFTYYVRRLTLLTYFMLLVSFYTRWKYQGPSISTDALQGRDGVKAEAYIYCFYGVILLFKSVHWGKGCLKITKFERTLFMDACSENWRFSNVFPEKTRNITWYRKRISMKWVKAKPTPYVNAFHYSATSRSSSQKVYCKKAVLKKFAKFI